MTTKQINDLISFVAMNAMGGVDFDKANEWIAHQNFKKEVAEHLQRIVNNIAACNQYVVTLRGLDVFHECSVVCSIPKFSEYYISKIKSKIKDKYNLEVYDFANKFGIWSAWTNNKNIKVFIEPLYSI